ncbi:MAG: hypothetical protein IT262_06455 [Saprospiraceae bacterium]|nr:hypothetical protein [Saprospiraceae bacterium]
MKQQSLKLTLVMMTILFGMVACKKENTECLPPQQQLPNPLPENALVVQLKRTDLDHESFSYNYKGQVSQLRSQWQFVEGDPTQIRTQIYDFVYDTEDKPVRINTTGGSDVIYFYKGNRVEKMQELLPQGEVAKEVYFSYANGRIVQEYWDILDVAEDTVSYYKHDYYYDEKSNLTKIVSSVLKNNLYFTEVERIEYSDFDDKINPISWKMRYPYIPQIRYQFNNPRKEVRTLADGQKQTTTYSYEYNAAGLPIIKHVTLPSGYAYVLEYLY